MHPPLSAPAKASLIQYNGSQKHTPYILYVQASFDPQADSYDDHVVKKSVPVYLCLSRDRLARFTYLSHAKRRMMPWDAGS